MAKRPKKKAGRRLAGWLATQLFVTLAWVLFRSPTVAAAALVYKKLFGLAGPGARWIPEWFFWCLPIIIIGQAIGVMIARLKSGKAGRVGEGFNKALSWLGWQIDGNGSSGLYLGIEEATILGSYVVVLWMLLAFYFSPSQASPFIYLSF